MFCLFEFNLGPPEQIVGLQAMSYVILNRFGIEIMPKYGSEIDFLTFWSPEIFAKTCFSHKCHFFNELL